MDNLTNDIKQNSLSITIAICALNEADNLFNTFLSVQSAAKNLENIDIEIIIVDDGSTDSTGEVATRIVENYPNVHYLKNDVNRGLGYSIARAVKRATGEKFLFVPGDNDLPVNTLVLLMSNANLADVVMTYFLNNELRGRSRYILSSMFKLIYSLTFDLYLIYLNGPAVYPTSKLKEMRIFSSRFSIVAEINIKLLRQGCSFIELAGSRQVGMDGSTSASFKSLLEVLKVYLLLVKEIYLTNRYLYQKTPKRVSIDNIELSKFD